MYYKKALIKLIKAVHELLMGIYVIRLSSPITRTSIAFIN